MPLAAVQAHLDAFNARDIDALVAAFAEDAVFATGSDLVVGARGIRAFFAEAFAYCLDARLELEGAVVDGDTVSRGFGPLMRTSLATGRPLA